MKINATIDLTSEELLDALTEKVNSEYRYSSRQLPVGEAVGLELYPDCSCRVHWGQRPVPGEPTPETSVPIECKPSCCSSDAS